MLAGPVAGDPKLRVDAAFPVQVEDMLRRLIGVGHDNVFEHRAQDAFLQGHRRGGMLPQRTQIRRPVPAAVPAACAVNGSAVSRRSVDARL